MTLEGIHHISAITGDAPGNVDFYTRVLGLRLVAKTVNQDDPSVYHLFYADEQGSPGAELTFFEYPGARRGRAGSGMVHSIVSSVGSTEAIEFWEHRLSAEGVATERTDDGGVRFADPEGLGHELVVSDANAPLLASHPDIPYDHALRGFVAVRAYSKRLDDSVAMLERVMGATALDETTWQVKGERRGGTISFDTPPAERAVQGAGTVHHIAWGTTVAEHPRWFARLHQAGWPTSSIIDRYYFHSIYFREPGGVLYEIADDAPGFTRDLPVEALGTRIILPPWLEERREEVEAQLTPLPDPRAGWPVGSPS